MQKETEIQENRTERGPAQAGLLKVHNAPGILIQDLTRRLGVLLVLLTAASDVLADYEYSWLTTRGPVLKASFQASDSAVAKGIIKASDIMSMAPGFSASASVGTFSNLAPDSALSVNPVTGGVMVSTNGLTATNGTDTLLLSANGYFIPTSLIQSRGSGIWRVVHLGTTLTELQLFFLGFTNNQAQLLVTCTTNVTFVVKSSTDLLNWTPTLTNQIVDGVSTVIDPSPAVEGPRFYRAVTGM